MRTHAALLLIAALTLGACNEQSVLRPLTPDGALLAKPAPGPSNASAAFLLPTSGSGVRGDGLFLDGADSKYTDKVCGVTATIFAPNPGQDAVMQTDNPSASDRKCSAYGKNNSVWPRDIVIDFGDGSSDVASVTMNVHDLGTVMSGSALLFFGIGVRPSSHGCAKVQFGSAAGGDPVLVTRVDANTWHVASQDASHTAAVCVDGSGTVLATYSIPVDFTVTTP